MRSGATWCLGLLALAGLAGACLGDDEPQRRANLSITASSNRFGAFELFSMDIEGKAAERLVREGDVRIPAQEPAWSASGKRVVFASRDRGRSQIYLMDARGRDLRALTDTQAIESKPTASPDGRKIAFCSTRDGNEEVYVMNADGTDPVNLTRDPGRDNDPTWLPDGKSIAFASDRGGRFRVWVINADGTEPRELVHRDLFGWLYPAFSPDGKQLAYGGVAPDNSYQLFLARSNDDDERQLTRGGQINSYAAWSPDGRYLAYVHFDKNPPGFNPGGRFDPEEAGGDLMLHDLREGTHTRLIEGELPIWGPRPAWRPDPQARPGGP